jgi:hypothetical protein
MVCSEPIDRDRARCIDCVGSSHSSELPATKKLEDNSKRFIKRLVFEFAYDFSHVGIYSVQLIHHC